MRTRGGGVDDLARELRNATASVPVVTVAITPPSHLKPFERRIGRTRKWVDGI